MYVLTTVFTTDICNYNFTKTHWVGIKSSVQCSVFRFFPRKFNVLFKFNYYKYNPRGFIIGGAYTWKEFYVGS